MAGTRIAPTIAPAGMPGPLTAEPIRPAVEARFDIWPLDCSTPAKVRVGKASVTALPTMLATVVPLGTFTLLMAAPAAMEPAAPTVAAVLPAVVVNAVL